MKKLILISLFISASTLALETSILSLSLNGKQLERIDCNKQPEACQAIGSILSHTDNPDDGEDDGDSGSGEDHAFCKKNPHLCQ